MIATSITHSVDPDEVLILIAVPAAAPARITAKAWDGVTIVVPAGHLRVVPVARTAISVPPAAVTSNTLAMIMAPDSNRGMTITALPTIVVRTIAVTDVDHRLRHISDAIAITGRSIRDSDPSMVRNMLNAARTATAIGAVWDMISVAWDRGVRRLARPYSPSTE